MDYSRTSSILWVQVIDKKLEETKTKSVPDDGFPLSLLFPHPSSPSAYPINPVTVQALNYKLLGKEMLNLLLNLSSKKSTSQKPSDSPQITSSLMPFSSLKGWLKRVLKRAAPSKRDGPRHCRLLELPVELLECVLEHTTLTDKIILSQACKILRERLSTECRTSFMQSTSEEKMIIGDNVARRLPDFRLCITCSQLHRYLALIPIPWRQ